MSKVGLSLAAGYPAAKTLRVGEWEIPWEVQGYRRDYDDSRVAPGFYDLSPWDFVEIKGPDALDYLQRMSTVDVKRQAVHETRYGAFLTGRGTVVTLGHLEKFAPDSFFYAVPPGTGSATVEHIEKFHFAENFTCTLASENWALFALWYPKDEGKPGITISPGEGFLWKDPAYPALYWLRVARAGVGDKIFSQFRRTGVNLLGHHLYEFYRIQNGVPEFGVDLSAKEIILEANFDTAVARGKGCYPGQEVVERIFTYGSVNRKMKRVVLDGWRDENETGVAVDLSVLASGENAGRLVAKVASPYETDRSLGLALVQKKFWDVNPLSMENSSVVVTQS